ncbi:MAG: RNA methyltransferase [Eubacterium sp.]|nr:RNA methyltransferase [Eubacterium sp.]
MITSTANKQVKNIIQLAKKARQRQEQDVFLAEGLRIFEEMPRERLEHVYISESFLQKRECMERLADTAYEVVSDQVFGHMSDTQTPQGILCIVRQPQYAFHELLGNKKEPPHLLILEGIRDPGNLGTMFRTAEGAGATGILLSGCADLFAPKTVRSTMGSICRMPFYVAKNLPETLLAVKKQGIRIYAAHLKGEAYYDAFDYRGACAFLIGNEGSGLTQEASAQADVYLKIPMGGRLESLNAAIAAGVLMYEVNRQRRI